MSADLAIPSPGPAPAGPYGPGRPATAPELASRVEAGRPWPMHVWRFDRPLRVISSGPYGGGLGERLWVINATVPRDYARLDPDAHVAELAAGLGLAGPGVGMLTAVNVNNAVVATDGGVEAIATVGLGYPTLAAAPDDPEVGGPPAADGGPGGRGDPGNAPRPVGTINIVAFLPAPLSDAALVNAVGTATEAKVQALSGCGFAATGTATDALVLACPVPVRGAAVEAYGGPRSTWGARLARAVHRAVDEGTRRWLAARR